MSQKSTALEVPKVPEVSESLTRQVANLARLELTDTEVTTFTPQLREVLKYVESLQSVNVQGVEPMTHPFELATPMREDVVRPVVRNADGQPKVLDAAPDVLGGGYKVPPIL